jgi:hypothetical protein
MDLLPGLIVLRGVFQGPPNGVKIQEPTIIKCEACAFAKIKRQNKRIFRVIEEAYDEKIAIDFHSYLPGINSYTSQMLLILLRAGSRRQASLRKTDAVGVRENLSSGPAKPGKPLREWIRIHSSRFFPSRSTRPYSCFSFSFY